MSSQEKKKEVESKKIPVDLVEIGPEQSRLRAVEKNIDDLVENIRRFGLLNPITVFPREGKYELLEGQRRLLAVKKLGWKEIDARIISRIVDPIEAKAISFSENFLRENLVRKDVIDACTAFYNRYGSMKAVAEELGLPYHRVRKYVLYDRLPDEMKNLVDDKKVALGHALKATDAATTVEGDIDVEKAVEIAQEIKTLTGGQKEKLTEISQERPTASAEEIIEEAKKPPKIIRLEITLALRHYESLKKAAGETGITESEAAVRGIIEWLAREGY